MRELWLVLLLGGLALSTSGCTFGSLRLRVPGFDSAAVEGVDFWLQDASGNVAFDGHIEFVAVTDDGASGAESLYYRVENTQTVAQWVVTLERDPLDPDVVIVTLVYPRLGAAPAAFRLSTYNAAGDSPLTTDTVVL